MIRRILLRYSLKHGYLTVNTVRTYVRSPSKCPPPCPPPPVCPPPPSPPPCAPSPPICPMPPKLSPCSPDAGKASVIPPPCPPGCCEQPFSHKPQPCPPCCTPCPCTPPQCVSPGYCPCPVCNTAPPCGSGGFDRITCSGRRRICPPPCSLPGPIPYNPCCPRMHKGHDTWKKYRAIFMAMVPIIFILSLYALGNEPPHKKICREFEYMRRRTKRFPWGDGNKTFFHNEHTNSLPEECEPPPLICEAGEIPDKEC